MANLLQNNSKLQLTDKETFCFFQFSSWALAETSFCTSRPLFLFYKHWVSLNPSKEVPPLKPFLSIRKASRNSESSIVLLSPHSSWSFFLLELPPVSLFCNFLGTECWVKENILHYSREPLLMRKPKLHIFHSNSTPFHSCQPCSPTSALSGMSPTAQTSKASSVKSSLADSWGLL